MSEIFALQKLWSHEPSKFVMALNPAGPQTEDLPKRIFLLVDGDSRPSVRLTDTKPEPLSPDHPFVELFRKYALPGRLVGVYRSSTKGFILKLQGLRSDQLKSGYIVVTGGGNWCLELVWEGRSLCRVTSAGVFTKPKPWEADADLVAASENSEGLSWRELFGDSWEKDAKEAKNSISEISLNVGATLSEEQRHLRDRLARRAKTVRKSFDRLQAELPTEEMIAEQKKRGEILQRLAPYFVPGSDRVTIPEALTDEPDPERTVFLDPDKTLGEQIDGAFSEAKRLAKARLKGLEMIAHAERNRRICEEDLASLRQGPVNRDLLLEIGMRHKLLSAQPTSSAPRADSVSGAAKPWRLFALDPPGSGFEALVGKSAAGNDELHRQSRGNDWFLHVVSPQGSHVVIPAKGKKDAPPEVTIRQAAILAIHFSKIRQDRGGEVYFTQRMYTVKRKGLAAGLVLIQKSTVLNIKYETEELSAIMGREIIL